MDTLAAADQSPVPPLPRRPMKQARVPGERRCDRSSVTEIKDDGVLDDPCPDRRRSRRLSPRSTHAMPSQGVLDAQSPAAEGEIAHVGRIRDWHAVGRGRARTWRSHRLPRHARASARPGRSSRRRTGMSLLGELSALGVILSPQLIPDRRSLTACRSAAAVGRPLHRRVRRCDDAWR